MAGTGGTGQGILQRKLGEWTGPGWEGACTPSQGEEQWCPSNRLHLSTKKTKTGEVGIRGFRGNIWAQVDVAQPSAFSDEALGEGGRSSF